MEINPKSLCVFTHFSNKAGIPLYVQIYLHELTLHFDHLIFVANSEPKREINIQEGKNIQLMLVKNEGYDLGMFYKAFQTIDPNEYSQIACINDSNILFNELQPIFNWSKNHTFDFWGLIDSYEKPWFSIHSDNFHIQSHFIVLNRKAIEKLPDFFSTIDFKQIYKEENKEKLRRAVINNWEIGLSQYLISKGLKHGSFIDSQSFSGVYYSGKKVNITHKLYSELIESGYPLIKKKVIAQNKWTDIFRNVLPWENMIRKYGNQNWEIESLINELNKIRDDSENPTLVRFRRFFHGAVSSFVRKDIA